jgi:DNA helicase-2/ATP-dependent DNA helicase PcrA
MLTCEGAVAISWSGYQRSIFRDVEVGDGHTVVLARAGSGKTTTILEALRHVPSGARVLMAAFNKSIERELAKKAPPRVEVRTLHGYGLSLVRGACGKAEIDEAKVPMLIEEKLGAGLPLQQRHALQRGVELAKATLAETAGEVRRLIDDFDLGVPDGKEGEFAEHVLDLLDACAANTQIVDFDDMIWLPIRLGLHPRTFDRVFVDETQDLNRCQVELALRACAPGGRICAVGDDRQAIYTWRGADPEAVPRMIERLDAKVLPLSVTYRCARAIVQVANEIVPDLEAAPGAAEGLVASTTEERLKREARPGDFILSRTNAPLVGLCLHFLAEGRPATVAGRDVGAGLTSLIRKSQARSVPELCGWVDDWAKQEAKRLEQKGKDRTGPKDKADCVRKLAEGARSVDEVLNTIQTLFSDKGDNSRIVLSTTHRAKGLERDRAWVLRDTYRRSSTEEENLWYVAVTRAKRELLLVQSAA